MGTPASIRASVAALSAQARRLPSWERTCRFRVMVLCGYRWVKIVDWKAEAMVYCLNTTPSSARYLIHQILAR